MGLMKTALALALAAAAAGCATTATPPGRAVPVPFDRIVTGDVQGDARIVVVRDEGMLGGGCYYMLYVNSRAVARLGPNERVTTGVRSGDLLLTVGRDPQGRALCGLEPGHRVQREFAIKAGETKHFRMAVGAGMMDIMRADDPAVRP